MNGQPSCPKCGKRMEEGYIPDWGDNYAPMHILSWVAKPPEKGFFGGLKTRDRENIQILSFRCSGCGYLESYAKK